MKCQDLFSVKKNECRLLQILLGALRVNVKKLILFESVKDALQIPIIKNKVDLYLRNVCETEFYMKSNSCIYISNILILMLSY